MPSDTFGHRVEIAASADEVWERLQVPETWTGLGPVQRVWDPEWEDGVLAGYRFYGEAGPQKFEGEARTRVAEPPSRLVVGFVARGFTGEMRALLTPNGAGTIVDVELHISTSDFFMSLVFGIVAGIIRGEFDEHVEGLADQIGAG